VRTVLGFLVDFADFFTTALVVDLAGGLGAFADLVSLLAALT
jgi:hypothetical protein